MAASVPYIQSLENISKLTLTQAIALAKNWNLNTKGIQNAEQLREHLISHWLENRQNGTIENYSLANASKEHEKTRDKLYEKYTKAEELYSKLTPKIQSNLEQSHPDVQKTFKENKESLKLGECTIVVAGEVGAGKSSLINMILETQIFPTDALKCTNTICEIRYHERKEAFFFFKPVLSESGARQRKVAPRIIKLDNQAGIQEFKELIQKEDNPYQRCAVYYPFPTLSKGVVLVDTPGIEGGENVDQRLLTLLSRAFGFIYVINTKTAGGVQQDRLGHLLKTVVNSCEDFSAESTLFVGNKWETIPERDREDVQKDTFNKLSQIYPGLRSHQVHYMSVKKSGEIMMTFKQYNARTEEHNILLRKLSALVPSALRPRMVSHYWCLSSFLSRTSYLLRVSNAEHKMSKEETEKKLGELRERVENLKKNASESVDRLKCKVYKVVDKITKSLHDLLKEKDFVNSLCDWEDTDDCPSANLKWKNTADNAEMKISVRLARIVDVWVLQHGILENINREIIEVFSRELGLVDHQIQEIEGCLTGSRNDSMLNTFLIVPVKAFLAKKTKKIEKTYYTLGGAVSCIGMLNTDKTQVRKIFRDGYNDTTKATMMAEASVLYLESILYNKDFSVKLRKFFARFFKDIDEAVKRIPGFLQADQQLIDTLRKTLYEEEEISHKCPSLLHDCSELLSQLDIFYIDQIMTFDFDLSELDWDNKKEVGRGAFAAVYASSLKSKDRKVALKVSSEEVNQANVTDVLTEDRTMRDLQHENVVKYYGASYEKKQKGLYWIMVMELCQDTLKSIYTGSKRNEQNIPGGLDKDHPLYSEAARIMLDHFLQLCRGLEYIHGKGYTHRDMKLENVLLFEGNVVKITDVGVAKLTKRLLMTCNGSPAYMAPEVLLSNRNQTNKIDIYSIAIMFWEMWFGKDVAVLMNNELLGPGFRGDAMGVLRVKVAKPDGWRPLLSATKKPPDAICDLVRIGWSFDPDSRPTAEGFGLFIKDFLRNNLN